MDEERLPSFTVLEWVDIAGRGTMAIVTAAEEDSLPDPAALLGRRVLLDGQEKLVAGVETRAIPRGEEYPYRGAFGLLVREPGRIGNHDASPET